MFFFFFQAEDGIRDSSVTGVQTCALPISFGQVSITEPFVDMAGNCGNISSAVGPYAIDKGLVSAVDPVTTVRIFNTNTKKMIVAEVSVREGRVVTQGTYQINGVPGTGAEIKMHFVDPGGAITGKLRPTGNVADKIKRSEERRV